MSCIRRFTSVFFVLSLLFGGALWAEVGSVTLLVGKAHIERGAEKLSVANGTLIEEQDKVMTEENSRVQLTFKDNTIITLGSKSHLAVNEFFLSETQAPKASFSVAQGVFKTITGQIGKVAPENFKLVTKTAAIGIRGTIFEGRIEAEEDLIQCIQGSIVVSSLDSSLNFAPVIVKAGEMTTVGFNAAPTPPAPIPAGESGLVLAPSSDEDSQASEAEPFVVVSNGSDDTPSSTSASEGIASYERLASVAQERQESGADESKDKALERGDSNTSTPGLPPHGGGSQPNPGTQTPGQNQGGANPNLQTQKVALSRDSTPYRDDDQVDSGYAGVNYANKNVLLLARHDNPSISGQINILISELQSDGALAGADKSAVMHSFYPNGPMMPKTIGGGLVGKPGSAGYALQGSYEGEEYGEMFSEKLVESSISTQKLSALKGIKIDSSLKASSMRIDHASLEASRKHAYVTDKFFAAISPGSFTVATPEGIMGSDYLSWGYWDGGEIGSASVDGYPAVPGLWVAGKESAASEAARYIQGLLNGGSTTLRYSGATKGYVSGLIKPELLGSLSNVQPIEGSIDLVFKLGANQSSLDATFRFSPLHPGAIMEEGKEALREGVTLTNLQGSVGSDGGFAFRDDDADVRGSFYGSQAQEAGGAFSIDGVVNGVFHAKKR